MIDLCIALTFSAVVAWILLLDFKRPNLLP
jgi:hypothetical protein